ncbi:hypothetical protein FOA52_004041 [Chlamydomonas sp. UWO 241]|nr:hypothetical protein FOA52_004041 [Chlamydomonas sp. UWO 241]
MADGIPIAGKLGDGGVALTDLDICGGHVDATYAYYHYHSVSVAPYTVRCLRGYLPTGISGFESMQTSASSSCSSAATQYDYSSLMKSDLEWILETRGSATVVLAPMVLAVASLALAFVAFAV